MDNSTLRPLELLAPAANAEIAIEAILHGADAVYIGGPSHGARKSAANSIEDIRRVVELAHQYGARVYVTLNTIIYEHELKRAESLAWDLYRAGVDALIVQDMALLRLNLPPIALHSSTQCDTRTPEKARFLQDVGFSQIVLARELTLEEIAAIHDVVSVPLECFVHGALCVSYSGRCHASQSIVGRSANRGECAQVCRFPFTLKDADGKVLARDKHLLSLKDFNLLDRLESLIQAGASSFKIEGRLKDAAYVKNIVALYRQRLDEIIAKYPDRYKRSSAGRSEISFTPNADKSFNRGFTHYFIDSRRPKNISSPLTPKSMGEEISDLSKLHNGDGISFFNERGEYVGVQVNGVKGNRILSNKPFHLPKGAAIHRTLDIQWQKEMARPTATRRMDLDVTLTPSALSGVDERGVMATVALNADIQPANNPRDLRQSFDKFGNTIYRLREFRNLAGDDIFIPASQLADARRRLLEALATASRASYDYDRRRPENREARYPSTRLDYQDNVANSLARNFYAEHGVRTILPAMEIEKASDSKKYASDSSSKAPGSKNERVSENKNEKASESSNGMRSVMTTRHCILREMGYCLRETPAAKRPFRLPLTITSTCHTFRLDFDCAHCEMHLLKP